LPNFHADTDHQLLQARQIMERVFGFHEFRPGQEEIVEAVFSGEDVLAVMPTGAGKSCPEPAWSSLRSSP
jgi:ATP-dependent DNA helicase RecQ